MEETEKQDVVENKNKTWFIAGVIVVVLAGLGVFFFTQRSETSPDPVVEDDTTEQTGDVTGNEENEGEEVGDAGSGTGGSSGDTGGAGSGGDTLPDDVEIKIPTVSTNEYSVFLGFAADLEEAIEVPEPEEVSVVVTGYEWEVVIPSPFLATIELPDWEPESEGETYSVEVWDDKTQSYSVLGDFSPNEEITFPREGFAGARVFKVTGIDPELGICPGERSFIWDARFTFEAEIGLIRTPITQALPAGQTCTLR